LRKLADPPSNGDPFGQLTFNLGDHGVEIFDARPVRREWLTLSDRELECSVAAKRQTLWRRIAVTPDANVEALDDPPPAPKESVHRIDHDDEVGVFASPCPPRKELARGFDHSLGGLVTLRHGESVAHGPGGAEGRPGSALQVLAGRGQPLQSNCSFVRPEFW
jgi:hypothetical protein